MRDAIIEHLKLYDYKKFPFGDAINENDYDFTNYDLSEHAVTVVLA
jgi:hypothetical protein